jgi:putative transposase
MAHLGAQRCMAMMINEYYWPNMRADIADYVKTCAQCQSNKPDRRRNVPALSPLVPPSSSWRTLGVDLITELPMTVSGFNVVCVFICHLSKMVQLVPTTSRLDAVGFAKLFAKSVLITGSA